MELSDVNKIEIIRTKSGAWNANVEHGPWACYATPENALKKLLTLLRPSRRVNPTTPVGSESRRAQVATAPSTEL